LQLGIKPLVPPETGQESSPGSTRDVTAFYFLDYVHLYGDMEGSMNQDPTKKDFSYFACDILTCIGYLFAFIALKIPNYETTIYVFGIVPWLFLWYKRKNKKDRYFFSRYGIVAATIAIARFIGHWWGVVAVREQYLALIFMIIHVCIYAYYVFMFHEKHSAKIDEQLYEGSSGDRKP
jgi:hypothetical protein